MATVHWKSGVSGDWADVARWREGVVPGAGDDAVVGAMGTYQVTIDSAQSVGSLTINGAGATVLDENTLTLGGTLDVASGTFELFASGSIHTEAGVIQGGTITATGGAFDWQGGTLSGVTFEGTLTVGSHESFTVEHGLTGAGLNGIGPGVIQMEANSTILCTVQYPETTLDNMTLIMGSAAGPTTLIADFELSGETGSGVILGPDFLLDVTGPQAVLRTGGGESAGFFVEGEVLVGSGGVLNVDALSVSGTVMVDGGVMTVGPKDEGNSNPLGNLGGTHTLTGGAFTVAAGGTLDVNGRTLIYTDNATIVLDGPGSVLESFGNGPGGQVTLTLDQTLTRISAAGDLAVLGARGFAGDTTLLNQGTITLGGGTFGEASLTNSGTVGGYGTIAAAVTNNQTLSAAGGVLEVDGAVTGKGRFVVAAGATLRFDAAATAMTATFAGAGGTLGFADPDAFAGKVAGFAAGDTIDLIGIVATTVTRTPGTETLVFSDGGSTVASLTLSGNYVHDTFALASDGAGGTNVTVMATPAAARLAQAMAAVGSSTGAGAAHTAPATHSSLATLAASPG